MPEEWRGCCCSVCGFGLVPIYLYIIPDNIRPYLFPMLIEDDEVAEEGILNWVSRY
jgi:hypothetical protein